MGKFSTFLERFSSEFIVRRQPGSDFIVVPVDRPELLATERQNDAKVGTRIREDLFEALTKPPSASKGKAFYLPENDTVVWVRPNEQQPASAVALPEGSTDRELEIRKNFADQLENLDLAKNSLLESLANKSPLRSFSFGIRSFGLISQWHQFRLSELSTRLRDWSIETAVPWKQEWVDIATSAHSLQIQAAPPVGIDSQKHLLWLATQLTDDEVSRINIPLDVVLRLLSKN